jgi:hypothetical protein
MNDAEQRTICARFGAEFVPSHATERVGIALQSLSARPLNALRHVPENGTCGWYIWGGNDFPDDEDYFQPLCVEHLPDHCPDLIPYLALAPGWRVLLAPNYEDVWFDEKLLAV